MGALQLHYEYTPSVIICLTGLVFNSLLLNVFIKDPLNCFKNSGSYLIINLAVSDFLTCLTAPFYFFISIDALSMQSVLRIVGYYFISLSCLTIVSLSVDRYLLIVHPLKHRILLNEKRIVVWIAALWVMCLYDFTKEMIFGAQKYDKIVISSIGVTAITFSAVMYSLTCFTLIKQIKNMADLQCCSLPTSRAELKRIFREKKFLRTIILIACIAFVCIVPPRVLFTVSSDFKNKLVSRSIGNAIFFINFAVNPLVYTVRLSNYRKSFYLLYCKQR